MFLGYLQVKVTTYQTALPIKDVTVSIIDSTTMEVLTDKTMRTNQDGNTEFIELETVSKELSLDEKSTELPYKNYNIAVEKEGYIKGEIIGVQIFEGQKSIQCIDLLPRPTDYGNDYEIELYTGKPQQLFAPEPFLQRGINTYVLPQVVIPDYVTVHLGRPDDKATDVRVPFIKYLKSVAASEIYPTWPLESLRANIYAQISFILNRVYTEWYRSRGYEFDITNSTSFDQKYIDNRSTFESTDKVVEDLFNSYVTKEFNKEPFFTEYCDGKQVSCPGMKQWGTYDKALQGKKALDILKDYYGDNIQISTSDNIASIPVSYPGTTLKRGSTGQNVKIIQSQLNRIGDNYPAIRKLNVDGIFGANMEAAVKTFQSVFNLTQDGAIGKQTWYKISYIYVAVKKLAELTSEGEAIQDGAYPGFVIERGDKGTNVLIVQYYINVAAVYISSIYEVNLDGIFGAGLEEQVKNFQRYFNLTADGKVGELTWTKMFSIYLSVVNGATTPQVTPPTTDEYKGVPLRVGSTGNEVRKIQEWLNGVAQVYQSVPPVIVDGKYGPATQNSVIEFQKRFNLTQDGVVGPATWNKLYGVWQDLVANGKI